MTSWHEGMRLMASTAPFLHMARLEAPRLWLAAEQLWDCHRTRIQSSPADTLFVAHKSLLFWFAKAEFCFLGGKSFTMMGGQEEDDAGLSYMFLLVVLQTLRGYNLKFDSFMRCTKNSIQSMQRWTPRGVIPRMIDGLFDEKVLRQQYFSF